MDEKYPLFDRVMSLMEWDDDKTRLWFRTKNPNLGGVAPDYMISNGREARLRRFVTEAEINAEADLMIANTLQ